MGFKFEKLHVWQKAVTLSSDVHRITRKFPKEELYILTAQFKRAADSIALNIAEGSTGQTNAGFRQFIGYAVRSAIEVITCLHLAKGRTIISEADFKKLYEQTEEIIRMLSGLKNALS